MSVKPFNRREYQCFISYASEDSELAYRIAQWLGEAGLEVWIDRLRLHAAMPVLDELTRQIRNSRGCLLVLTAKALQKNYVKHEVDSACDEQINHPGFAMLAVRTDSRLNPTERFPALTKVSWMDLPNGELDLAAGRGLLLAVTPGLKQAPAARHVYVSCGWGENDAPITQRICLPLAARGVRLIGDAMDQKHFRVEGKTRVKRIMSGCSGHLMILPERHPPNKIPEETYEYFLTEWAISGERKLARRAFCVSRAALPPQLQSDAIEVGTAEDASIFEPELVALHDETEQVAPYIFLATEYNRFPERHKAAKDVIEHVIGMRCLLGTDSFDGPVSQGIVEIIKNANFVLANLASAPEENGRRLHVNVNTCIEAGIAKGAGRPVFITALDPTSFDAAVTEKTRQLPFMFRDSQINWYASPTDYLAKCHKLAMMLRRRIINDELPPAA